MTKATRNFWLVMAVGTALIILAPIAMVQFLPPRALAATQTSMREIIIVSAFLVFAVMTVMMFLESLTSAPEGASASRLVYRYASWRKRRILKLRERIREDPAEEVTLRRMAIFSSAALALLWLYVLAQLSNRVFHLFPFLFPKRPFSLPYIGVESLIVYAITLSFWRHRRWEKEAGRST